MVVHFKLRVYHMKPRTLTDRLDSSREAKKESIGRELMLVSVLSRIWPDSHLCLPFKPQKNLPGMVCLHSPLGVMMWRLSADELPLFDHLPLTDNHADDYKARDKEALLMLLASEGWVERSHE